MGPVVKSKEAKYLQLNTNMLDWLLGFRIYERPFPGAKFNPNFVVQLRRNYRSVAQLLHLPSSLFYENKLIPTVFAKNLDPLSTFLKTFDPPYPLGKEKCDTSFSRKKILISSDPVKISDIS